MTGKWYIINAEGEDYCEDNWNGDCVAVSFWDKYHAENLLYDLIISGILNPDDGWHVEQAQ